MKTFVLLIILTSCGSVFAQSKKELRAQLVQQQVTIDSLKQLVVNKDKTIDTLTMSFVETQRSYNRAIETNKDLIREYDHCRQQVNVLERENNEMKTAKEAVKPTTKNTTTPTKSATNKAQDNPFGNYSGGNGAGLGNDNGTGLGPGKGSASDNRYLVRKPNTSNIISDENCRIVFEVTVDANGDVVGVPSFVGNGTTTDDLVLIKKVAELVQSEAKYNKRPGSQNVKLLLNVHITAQAKSK